MGLHYNTVVDNFKHCPTLVCVGATSSGKTLCTMKAMDLIAVDGAKKLEYISISIASLRTEVFKRRHLPVLLHDPASPEVLKALAEETYERKPISNYREQILPGSSAIVTCNADYLSAFRAMDGLAISLVSRRFPKRFLI